MKRYVSLVLGFLVLIISSSLWVFQRIKFNGVESWHSVPVLDLSVELTKAEYAYFNESGHGVQQKFYSDMSYRYNVEGLTYTSSLLDANNNSFLMNKENLIEETVSFDGGRIRSFDVSNKRAYYKPSDPSLAVLDPISYRGFYLLTTIVGSIMFIVVSMKLNE